MVAEDGQGVDDEDEGLEGGEAEEDEVVAEGEDVLGGGGSLGEGRVGHEADDVVSEPGEQRLDRILEIYHWLTEETLHLQVVLNSFGWGE